ncbi:MAG: N-acetyl-gamma-glutamyl-phosphate reductase [Firmicutes bacterium]|nr:N-acetyl-gamma-glutamyl-phosphate reductase [Bacillota bacterium]
MTRIGILGDGYTAEELVRLLCRHPDIELVQVTSIEHIGQEFAQVYPNLARYTKVRCVPLDLPDLVAQCDLIFVALPHGLAVPVVREVVRQGKKVVDLGADFRFHQADTYEQWYHVEHGAPELLREAVYGLPELYGAKIKTARIVANPGCYPTSAILGLAPALHAGLIDPETIIIDAKSGVSGAGRTLALGSHFSECNENVKAYNVGVHRHTPEIEQELSALAGRPVYVSFSPHLIPMTRGMLSTIYGRLIKPVRLEEVHAVYRDFYADKFFIRVLEPGELPQTKRLTGSNHCDIGLVLDQRTGRLVILSAIDNLVKGASGQAIQNMNLMFGYPETQGLEYPGLYP